jgi:hypothetical protein
MTEVLGVPVPDARTLAAGATTVCRDHFAASVSYPQVTPIMHETQEEKKVL